MSRLWVVVYDIADDKRRRSVAGVLGKLLQRTQESVFEGWLTATELARLCDDLHDAIDHDADKMRFYPMAVRVPERRSTRGPMHAVPPAPTFWLL